MNQQDRDRLAEQHIVALSGGKDSTALALRLAEVEPRDYEYICTPTGNELPEMEEHWAKLETLLGKPLMRLAVYDGDGLIACIRDQKCIPNYRKRFCTRILKIEPMLKYLTAAAPCVHYVGLRADEEERAGIYGSIPGVTHRYPMREWGWGVEDVFDYLRHRGVSVPIRTDCALCFFQKIAEWKRLYRKYPDHYRVGMEIEQEVGHTFRSPQRDSWPAPLSELAIAFDGYRGLSLPSVDERQLGLFGNCDQEMFCRVCSL
jgi:hypothetical protein